MGAHVPYLEGLRGKNIYAAFYDPDGETYGLPTYPWRWAPDGLLTIRQLRGSPPRGPGAAQQASRRHGMSRYCGQPWWSTAGFKILAGSFSQVELGGLEPPTPCLQSGRSAVRPRP
jgi:hypothetical protein